jgi:5-carboxymethyl-2-hydroxymuconate isomerase
VPHLTLEYSANLRDSGEWASLCRKLATVLASREQDGKPVFPLGGIRVRAIAADAWCIGDGSLADAAFVHARLMIGAGRSEPVKREAGDALFAVVREHFAQSFVSRGLALSLEIGEFGEAGTWKHNNLHERFRVARRAD